MTANAAWDALQQRAHGQIWNAIDQGHKATVCAAPTGFGKTRTAIMSIREAEKRGLEWVFYTNRVSLFSQTKRVFDAAGVEHATRASGWSTAGIATQSGQIAMMPTEVSRIKKSNPLHKAKLVFVDEAHLLAKGASERILRMHMKDGAQIVGLTATPIDLGHLYTNLEVLATKAELRKVGGIVPFECWSPFEVDLRHIKKVPPGSDVPLAVQAELFKNQQVVGSIIDYWFKLNPAGHATLGFAPDVSSCYFMVDEFRKAGIAAASVDGEAIYYGDRDMDKNPIVIASSDGSRQDLFEQSRTGEIKVIWNRFVLREGIDMPWVKHLILACILGSPQTFDQTCGRGGRAHDGKTMCTIQDHGGNTYRPGLGNPNADRIWDLSATAKSMVQKAIEARTPPPIPADTPPDTPPPEPKEYPPISCEMCHKDYDRIVFFKTYKGKCPRCGHQHNRVPQRQIIQKDGKLKLVENEIKAKRIAPEYQKLWDGLFFRSRNKGSKNGKDMMMLRQEFEKAGNGRFEIVMDFHAGVTKVHDKQTGKTGKLGWCPTPGSSDWAQRASEVEMKKLQFPLR